MNADAGKECGRISIKKEYMFQWHNLLSRKSTRGRSDMKGRGMSQLHTPPQHLTEIKELILWKGWLFSILLEVYELASLC